jgi:hypothetical protein
LRAVPYDFAAMTRPVYVLLPLAALVLCLSACGGSGDDSTASRSQPTASAADFPSPKGKSMLELKRGLGAGPVLAPTVQQIDRGKQRYGFALFTTARKQISGIPVALYVARSGSRKLSGPFVARDESLEVAAPFRSETVAKDPDAAKSLYVSHVPFAKAGTYAVMGVAKLDGRLVATDPIAAHVLASDPVPNVGDKAPVIDTPTVKSAGGNVGSIDTRTPPDDMHDVSFASVAGKKPVLLLFATPALCQSRVCGPVVDIAEELKNESKGQADFIHMEIYRDNTIKPGCLEGTRPQTECLRPQVLAYHLETEPWAFAIDRHGRVAARLEGAYSKAELQAALKVASSR